MTLSEIIDCINKLENEYDFVNFKIYEIDIWPLLRIILYGKLHASEYIENNLSIKNDNKYNNIWIKRIKKLTKVVSILKHFDTEIFNLHKIPVLFDAEVCLKRIFKILVI